MPVFSLLADPQHYYPCTQDMRADREFRDFWLGHFLTHFDLIARLAVDTYGPAAAARAAAAKDDLARQLGHLRETTDDHRELHLDVLGRLRQRILKEHDIPDPFLQMKHRENSAMLALLPQVLSELDRHSGTPEQILLLLIEGVFAGNIFDLGASATAGRFAGESPDFVQIRTDLANSRPWLVDHFDIFAQRLLHAPAYHEAMFFVDNAGSDAVLGILPLVRWLAGRGIRTWLLANEEPALNDLTFAELCDLLPQAAAVDARLAAALKNGLIRPASSGGDTPLIDMRRVSTGCNDIAAHADLLFLEGMGRGLESNFDALFTVDTVKLCMIKEPIIAQRHGGKVFDVILRFDHARTPVAAP